MEEDDNGTEVQGQWVKRMGYVSEHDVDVRWVLYYPNDPRPHGGLRIASLPGLPPGHLQSFIHIITKRWPKNPEELKAEGVDKYGIKYPIYGITQEEMEIYSLDENFESWENQTLGTIRELEKLYGVKIFNK